MLHSNGLGGRSCLLLPTRRFLSNSNRLESAAPGSARPRNSACAGDARSIRLQARARIEERVALLGRDVAAPEIVSNRVQPEST